MSYGQIWKDIQCALLKRIRTATDTNENSVYFVQIKQTQKPQQEKQDRTHIRTLQEIGED